jgi:hypothetical protein
MRENFVNSGAKSRWGNGEHFSTERELSQLVAGGITKDGWDNFDAGLSGDARGLRTIRAP